jgi:hypothetical protein
MVATSRMPMRTLPMVVRAPILDTNFGACRPTGTWRCGGGGHCGGGCSGGGIAVMRDEDGRCERK